MIGLGVISRYYLAALENMSDARLVAACDRDPGKADRVSATDFHTDYRELIAREDVDAVIINLPNHLHAPVCRDALASGKHVCCEKPLATSAAEARELEQLAGRHNRTLFTAFHRRYNDHVVELAGRLSPDSGVSAVELSYLERIEDHCGDDSWYLEPDKCGGGCVADNGPNAFDTLLHLLGPLNVRHCQVERDAHGIDRRAEVGLETSGGIPVTVKLDWSYPHGERKDISVVYPDGRTDRIDMLAGYPGFKSSLFHEYAGVLADFTGIVLGRAGHYQDAGRRVAELVDDAYSVAGR